MTGYDEELGFPGNREVVERAMRAATTQVLFLDAPSGPATRSLVERAADAVRGFERLPVNAAGTTESDVIAAARKDGIPADIAHAYLRAKSEVKTILAEHLGDILSDQRPVSHERRS